MLFLTLIAAVVLLVLDINNVFHLSYWVIALIGFAPVIVAVVIWLIGLAAVLIALIVGLFVKAFKAVTA